MQLSEDSNARRNAELIAQQRAAVKDALKKPFTIGGRTPGFERQQPHKSIPESAPKPATPTRAGGSVKSANTLTLRKAMPNGLGTMLKSKLKDGAK